jgi:hypothetical protein
MERKGLKEVTKVKEQRTTIKINNTSKIKRKFKNSIEKRIERVKQTKRNKENEYFA